MRFALYQDGDGVWQAGQVVETSEGEHALAPGFYVDDAGELHVDVPEVLRSQGIPVTAENIDQATELLAGLMRDQLPEAEVKVEE
jgi:hypothetical protein